MKSGDPDQGWLTRNRKVVVAGPLVGVAGHALLDHATATQSGLS